MIDKALEYGRVARWDMELPSGKLVFDSIKATRIGYDPKKFKHYSDFTNLVHPDDYTPMMDAMRRHLRGASLIYSSSYRIKDSDGNYQTYFDQGSVIEREGDYIKLVGVTLHVIDT